MRQEMTRARRISSVTWPARVTWWRALAHLPSLAAFLASLEFAGCAQASRGPGLLERQEGALKRLIQAEHDSKGRLDPGNLASVHYICTCRVWLGHQVPFLNPSIQRGAVKAASDGVPGSFCTVVGWPDGSDSGVATLCEILTLKDGRIQTNVLLLAWDPESDDWKKAFTSTDVGDTPNGPKISP